MTDQTIPADKVREIAEKMHHHASQEHVQRDAERYFKIFANQLDDLLPKRPTLADMTLEERVKFQWMQCDVTGVHGRWVLATPCDMDGDAGLVAPYGDICWFLPDRVTPLPDLPPLEWPGDQEADQ